MIESEPILQLLAILFLLTIIVIGISMMKYFNKRPKLMLDTDAVTDRDLINAGFRCLQKSYIRCKIYGFGEWRIFSKMDSVGYYLTHDRIITFQITPINNKGELRKILEFIKNE